MNCRPESLRSRSRGVFAAMLALCTIAFAAPAVMAAPVVDGNLADFITFGQQLEANNSGFGVAITDKPDIFIGHRVRFAGDVAKVTGPRALTRKDQDPSQKEQILVITRRPINQMLGEGGASLESGDKVLVSGVVHRSDFAAIERELGLDLDADTEKHFRGKPVVIVSEMVRTESHEPDEPDTAHARE